MARPAKSVKVKSGEISKEEAILRGEIEDNLRGSIRELEPPAHLTENQRNIFLFVRDGLVESDILSGLDVFVLSSFAVAVDRLQQIEAMVNEEPGR